MINTDYWLGLMRQLADEVRSLSAGPDARPQERRMYCAGCAYVLVTSDAERHYCPNGCGELHSHHKISQEPEQNRKPG
ncbi:MAG TPA: hypothetical protein VKP89_02380 [Burkholderiales bacterium]|nr:hypothetical protein [Burkholderiales bacterium]